MIDRFPNVVLQLNKCGPMIFVCPKAMFSLFSIASLAIQFRTNLNRNMA